jgi:chemotaxis response regulator CheB
MPRTRAGKTLRDKVIEFELGYERAGIKHYDSRVKWANVALGAYEAAAGRLPEVKATQSPVTPKKPSKAGPVVAGGASVGGAAAAAQQAGLPLWAVLAIAVGVGVVAFLIWKARK